MQIKKEEFRKLVKKEIGKIDTARSFYREISEDIKIKQTPMTAKQVYNKCKKLGCFLISCDWEFFATTIQCFDFEDEKIYEAIGKWSYISELVDWGFSFSDGSPLTIEEAE